jgi:chemotaxis protein MotA
MALSTILGLVIGLASLLVAYIMKGAPFSTLVNPAAYIIILGGTAGSVFIAFPMNEMKTIPRLFGKIFREQKLIAKREIINLFIKWAQIARREGILALESHVEEVPDEFMQNGLKMIIDGNDSNLVHDILLEEISVVESRHRAEALIFSQAGMYAPTLGVLGAVVGLIAALANLSDINVLGHAIAAAFVATLVGIFTGYVLWHPMANKLKRLSAQEIELKMVMVEGLLSIQAGISSIAIEQKLSVYISPEERKLEEKNKEVEDGQ